MHKLLLIGIVVMVSLGAILTVGQIWGFGMDWATYTKVLITLGILVVLAAFLLVVGADLGHQKKLKDDNYLD